VINWWRSSVTSLSHWPSTSVYNTEGVRHRVARICLRQRRLFMQLYSSGQNFNWHEAYLWITSFYLSKFHKLWTRKSFSCIIYFRHTCVLSCVLDFINFCGKLLVNVHLLYASWSFDGKCFVMSCVEISIPSTFDMFAVWVVTLKQMSVFMAY